VPAGDGTFRIGLTISPVAISRNHEKHTLQTPPRKSFLERCNPSAAAETKLDATVVEKPLLSD
jgi:hypothetical protein